ncbi:hypothetical protein [Janibacter melonis]|uniref:hypothetical protein n=1 Tax=Janibacter melonis TaxID=262209 RepID=UPI0012EE0FB8|nr:hypothetical protein [Janibacter melonis]
MLVLTWPLISRRGYPLSRDMVITPNLPLSAESLGLSSSAPRAVPLDAAVAVLDSLVGGELLARVAVVGGLVAVVAAAGRASASYLVPAQAFCVVFAVWNPFVVERLALGQWALLLGYAGVWGCVATALGPGPHARGHKVGPWLALGALTPTGSLLTGCAAVILFWRSPDRGLVRALAGLAQLPWVVPAFVGGASVLSDPAGVSAFSAREERPGGIVWTLVGLGGTWDRLSVPLSRSGWLGHATSCLVFAALVAMLLVLVRERRRPHGWAALTVLAAAGLALASISSFSWGRAFAEMLVVQVPGGGLLRDSQKWLAWFVVPAVLATTKTVDLLLSWVRQKAPVLLMTAVSVSIALPVILLPDAASVVWRTVDPVEYPTDFAHVDAALRADPADVVSLPWRAYRQLGWGSGRPTYDPASRWFDVRVVTSSDLSVDQTTIAGEDLRAAKVAEVLARDVSSWDEGLSGQGVGYVLMYVDDPAAVHDLPHSDLVYRGESLALWRLTSDMRPVDSPAAVVVWGLSILDVAVGLTLLAGGGRTVLLRPRRGTTTQSS